MRHSHLAVIQQHAVHLLDGSIGRVLSLKVDEGVALGAVLVAHHLEQRRSRRSLARSLSAYTSTTRVLAESIRVFVLFHV